MNTPTFNIASKSSPDLPCKSDLKHYRQNAVFFSIRIRIDDVLETLPDFCELLCTDSDFTDHSDANWQVRS